MSKYLESLKALGPGRILAVGVVLATVIAMLAVVGLRLSAPSMALLYSDLAIEDSGSIVTRLEGMGVPYELRGNGNMVYVPSNQVLRLRMSMAEEGLPSGGSIGWELFDKSDSLGSTSFVQNINHLRALEGELARTIRTIDRVGAARVHLVLPRRELFSRETRKPSASIIIKLAGGRSLEDSQVAAIQSLVAAAVPDLKADQVSIVDDRGNLLSQRKDVDDPGGAVGFTRTRAAYEAKLKSAVESLVEQSVGIGNVRAEVSAEMNFDRVTTNAEIYDPESQVARSTQTIEESNEATEGDDEQTVTVANNLPDAEEQQQTGPKASTRSGRTEETVNYEISRTVRTEVQESGSITRLSVAVLVDGHYTLDDAGERQYQPRSEEELQQIEALVRSSIGFDADRGDQIEVINLKFSRLEDDPDFAGVEEALFTKDDYIRMGEIGALTLLGLLTILLVLRPLMGRMNRPGGEETQALPAPDGGQQQITRVEVSPEIIKAIETGDVSAEQAQALLASATTGEVSDALEDIDVAQIEGKVKKSTTKKLVELVERHPEEAVGIMRSWMYADA